SGKPGAHVCNLPRPRERGRYLDTPRHGFLTDHACPFRRRFQQSAVSKCSRQPTCYLVSTAKACREARTVAPLPLGEVGRSAGEGCVAAHGRPHPPSPTARRSRNQRVRRSVFAKACGSLGNEFSYVVESLRAFSPGAPPLDPAPQVPARLLLYPRLPKRGQQESKRFCPPLGCGAVKSNPPLKEEHK